MEDNEHQPEKGKKDKSHKGKLFDLLDELSWEIPFVRPIFTFFVKEGAAMKNGWVAFLIMAGICVFATHEFEKHHREDAERERDKYFQALQPWQALAAAIYTNSPPDERVSLLLSNVSEIKKSLASAKLKPLKQRVIDCLNSIDSRMIPGLSNGQTNFHFALLAYQYQRLRDIADEPGAEAYLVLKDDPGGSVYIEPKGQRVRGFIELKAELLNSN